MIILRLSEENIVQKRRDTRKRGKTKERLFNYSRSGIIIDNKPHFVITVDEKTLEDYEFQCLLDKYKGSIIVPEDLENTPGLSDLLFDDSAYIKKAIFENFKTMIFSGEYKSASLLIKDNNFGLSEDIVVLLPYVKNMVIQTTEEHNTRTWQEDCFTEYGIKPKITDEKNDVFLNFDIIADFNNIKNDFLEISIYDEVRRVYPNFKFLQIPDELKILENFNISKKTICAAFKK